MTPPIRALAPALFLASALATPTAWGELAPPGSSPERDMIDVVVRPGDTCESIASRLYGHPRYYYVLVEHLPDVPNVLRTTCDRALRPGAKLRLPRRRPESARPPDAKVSAVVRDVRSRGPAAKRWRAARTGQGLFRGWRVNTLERSEAELTFLDDSRVHLREETLVIIFGPTARTARRRTSKASLERGALRARLAELSGRAELDVRTPTARALLNGGEAVVSVDEEDTSHVANHTGRPARVIARGGGGEVLLRAGMGTSVRRGRPPEPPRRLLDAPAWREGCPALFVAIDDLVGSSIRGAWLPVKGATSYRVEITAGPDGATPIGATGVPGTVHQFELQGLPPGDYHVAVAAIDERGLEGPVGDRRAIHVIGLQWTPPPLGAATPRAVAADGRRHAILPVGSTLRAPGGATCSLGEGEASNEVVLSGRGTVSLRCRDAAGHEAPRLLLDLAPVELVARAPGGERPLRRLRRGERRVVRFEGLDDAAPSPGAYAVVGGPGIDVESVERDADGALRATLTVTSEAPLESHVELQLRRPGRRRVSLGAVRFWIDAAEAPPQETAAAPAPPRRPPPRPALETAGRLLGPEDFGVRDDRRRGSGLWVSLAYAHGRSDELARIVPALGLRLSAFRERLRVTLGVPAPLGAGRWGALVAAGSQILDGRPFGLSVELAAWLPLGAERLTARLVPSFDLSHRLGRRWTLRSRQGLMGDAARGGLLAWASAYAVDLALGRGLSLELEAALLLGSEDGGLIAIPSATFAAGYALGPLVLALGARVAMSREARARLGDVAVLFALRSGMAHSRPEGGSNRRSRSFSARTDTSR